MTTTLDKLSSYGNSFQIKVLSSLLKNKEFLQNMHDVLDADFFDHTSHKWIVEEIIRFYNKYNTTPTIDSLKVEIKKIDNEILQISVIEEIKQCYKIANEDQEYVEQEFSNFCKNQKLKQALMSSVEQLQLGNYDEIRSLIDHALKAGQDKNVGHNLKKDVESRYRHESRNPIPTPWEVFNTLLAGGLGEGDLGLIFGNPGGGKCVDEDTEIEIQYNQIGVELKNYFGKTFIMWIDPWDEFIIDSNHLYGWQIHKILEKK